MQQVTPYLFSFVDQCRTVFRPLFIGYRLGKKTKDECMNELYYHGAACLVVKVIGIFLAQYPIGNVLNCMGSVGMSLTTGNRCTYLLNYEINEKTTQPPDKKNYTIILLKYLLPLLSALVFCHYLYGTTLLTTAVIIPCQLYASLEMRLAQSEKK